MGGRNDNPNAGSKLALYGTPEHSCSYLPERTAVTAFVDPYRSMDNRLYSRLVQLGFRRSGGYVYRPACPACDACIPVRIPTADFKPDRSQRRTRDQNEDLEVVATSPDFRCEQFELYLQYMRMRHPGGDMDDPDPDKYLGFLSSSWSDTVFYEFRLAGRLAMVAVVDRLDDALSAVYSFFDPDLSRRGLGTYAILWQIEQARLMGLPWLYLGYLIRECSKMSYKDRFRPLEAYRDGNWLRITR